MHYKRQLVLTPSLILDYLNFDAPSEPQPNFEASASTLMQGERKKMPLTDTESSRSILSTNEKVFL